MFISLKLEQMINFALNVRLKRRAQKERHKKEREREKEKERERGDISLYPVLHLSLLLSLFLQSEVIKEYNVGLL